MDSTNFLIGRVTQRESHRLRRKVSNTATNPALRKLFSEKLEELMTHRLTVFQDKKTAAARERMVAMMSTYVGALILSRATRGTKLSDEILESSKKFLLKHLENL